MQSFFLHQIFFFLSNSAMENWGLVTYREGFFLYNVNEHSIGRKERVVSTIAHEFAHQWFGNLVTQNWWSVVWLKEGFASLLPSIVVDSVRHYY